MSNFTAGQYVRVKEGGWGFSEACVGDVVTLQHFDTWTGRWAIEEEYPASVGPCKAACQGANAASFEPWRPKVGEKVIINDPHSPCYGEVGELIREDESSCPFLVQVVDDGRIQDWWCMEDEVLPALLGNRSEEKELEAYFPEAGEECQINPGFGEQWSDITVIAIGEKSVFVRFHDDFGEYAYIFETVKFRKEDPEAAEAKAKSKQEIQMMLNIIDSEFDSYNHTEIVQKLYDAGCRMVAKDDANEE